MVTGATGHHCVKISPGCANCYSSRMQPMRFKLPEFDAPHPNKLQVFFDRDRLLEVLTRKKPTVWFWCDMTDLFGEWVRERWIDECFATMALTPQHTHLLLTKRTKRAFEYMTGGRRRAVLTAVAAMVKAGTVPAPAKGTGPLWPLPNVHLGASVENQTMAALRIPELLVTPAAGRFLSVEPQLGPITLKWAACVCGNKELAFKEGHRPECPVTKFARKPMFSQVIVGGESGARKKIRPFNLQWARSLIRQCHELRVPVFIKQLGSLPTLTPIGTKDFEKHPEPIIRLTLRSHKGNQMPEWPPDVACRERMT